MKTKYLTRLFSLLLCLCMAAGLLPATALAADDNPIDLTVTKGGQAVTEFSNTDSITITATLPEAVTQYVGSLHFVPADGGTMVEMYPAEGNTTISGNTVSFALDGLYEYDWKANAKGSQLSPGSYKIRFWNGSNMYTSTGTFTVTGSGSAPVTPQSNTITSVELTGATLSYNVGDTPKATARVPEGAKYQIYNEIWAELDENGYVAAVNHFHSYFGVFTPVIEDMRFESGKTYQYYVDLIIADSDDSSAFAGECAATINGSPFSGFIGGTEKQLLVCGPTMTPGEPGNGFTDVDAVYANAVKWAVEGGYADARSATAFGANDPCPRWEVVSILWKAMGSPEPTITSVPFTDVSADAAYYKAVCWAYEKKIALGDSATTFGPENTVERGQAMTFIHRAAGEPASTASTPFTDIPAGEYYAAPVRWAYEKGVANGTDVDKFSPEDPVTRAQMVTFLYRWAVENA